MVSGEEPLHIMILPRRKKNGDDGTTRVWERHMHAWNNRLWREAEMHLSEGYYVMNEIGESILRRSPKGARNLRARFNEDNRSAVLEIHDYNERTGKLRQGH